MCMFSDRALGHNLPITALLKLRDSCFAHKTTVDRQFCWKPSGRGTVSFDHGVALPRGE